MLKVRDLEDLSEKTGVPVLINTSLNRRGEPMVCSPEDALTMFFACGLEHMVLGDFYVSKRAMDPSFGQEA